MAWDITNTARLRRLFSEGFSAMDVAEALVSFDAQTKAEEVLKCMEERSFDLVGIRQEGLVCGYVRREDLGAGTCQQYLRAFAPEDDLIPDTASLTDVVKSLAINERCFVTILEKVGAIITLSDLEKPPMRMFLFGIITLAEMIMTDIIKLRFSDGSWRELISEKRLGKALEIQAERARRGQQVNLVDCLQYGDKGWILSYDEEFREAINQSSRKEARKAVKEIEGLRNNLAHSQEIVPTGWERIVIACSRFEANLDTIAERINQLTGTQERP